MPKTTLVFVGSAMLAGFLVGRRRFGQSQVENGSIGGVRIAIAERSLASTFVLTAEVNLFHLPLQSLHRAASTTEASFAREIVRLEELVELAQAPHVAQMVADEQRAAKILGQDVDPDPFDIEAYAADQLATATNALNDARKAFAISAYHRWEHAANRGLTALGLVGKMRPNTIVKIGEHLGWAVGRDMMGVQALVNLLKHDSTMAWGHLRTDWRQMWDRAQQSRTAADDGFADAVHLEKTDLTFILDCVSKAGPQQREQRRLRRSPPSSDS